MKTYLSTERVRIEILHTRLVSVTDLSTPPGPAHVLLHVRFDAVWKVVYVQRYVHTA